MPQALPYIASAAATAGGATAAQAAFIAFVVSVAVADYQRTSAMQRQRQQAADAIRSRNITLRSAIAPRTIALGTVRTSGPLMYAEFVGPDEEYLDSIVAINHGELSEVVGVYIGDEYIAASAITATLPTSGKYAPASTAAESFEEPFTLAASATITLTYVPEGGVVNHAVATSGSGDSLQQQALTVASVVGKVVTLSALHTGVVMMGYLTRDLLRPPLKVQWATGAAAQATTTWAGISAPKWGVNHRLRGVAYIRTLKLIDNPLFLAGDSGDVGAVIRGPKGVYDPRTGTTINYTSNPALLAAWYRTLAVADGGMGVPSGWINWASVGLAAGVCDELINVRTLDGLGFENVKRYECHTRLSLDRPPVENLQIILDAMAGDFPYSGGQYLCIAGAFRSATVTITDDDVVATAPMTFAPQAGASVAPPNVATATFYDAARNWVQQPARAVTNSAYVTADGAEEIIELDLQATTDERQANYLMGVRLERARPSLAASLTVTGKGSNLALMDTVQFSLQGYSAISGKTFEVRRRTNQWNGQYPLELREIKAASFALDAARFTAAAAVAPPVNSMLFQVDALTSVTAVEELVRQADGSIISRARVSWAAHQQGYVLERGAIRIRWRRPGDDWQYAAPVAGTATKGFTGPLIDNTVAAVEVQAINAAGAASAWKAAAPITVVGKAAPPANPTSVAATAVPGGVLVTWALNTEVDYSDTEIRSGASWAAGALAWRGTADRYLLPWPAAGAITLWVAHRDTSKNYSATPVSVALTVGAASLIGTANIGANAVNTSQIVAQAATATGQATSASGTASSTPGSADDVGVIGYGSLATTSWTNSTGRSVEVEVNFSADIWFTAGGATGASRVRFTTSGPSTINVNRDVQGAAGIRRLVGDFRTVTVADGQTLTMTVFSGTSSNVLAVQGPVLNWEDARVRFAAIKA